MTDWLSRGDTSEPSQPGVASLSLCLTLCHKLSFSHWKLMISYFPSKRRSSRIHCLEHVTITEMKRQQRQRQKEIITSTDWQRTRGKKHTTWKPNDTVLSLPFCFQYWYSFSNSGLCLRKCMQMIHSAATIKFSFVFHWAGKIVNNSRVRFFPLSPVFSLHLIQC